MKPIVFKKRKSLLAKLRELRRWIKNPERWTKGSYAETSSRRRGGIGDINDILLGKACKVCLSGGAAGVDGGTTAGDVSMALVETIFKGRWGSIPNFNDRPLRTHAEIVKVVDDTIARVEAR